MPTAAWWGFARRMTNGVAGTSDGRGCTYIYTKRGGEVSNSEMGIFHEMSE